MLMVSQVKLSCGSGTELLERKVRKLLRLRPETEMTWRIARHSIDARKKPEIYDVYSVEVSLGDERAERRAAAKLRGKNIDFFEKVTYKFPSAGNCAVGAAVSEVSGGGTVRTDRGAAQVSGKTASRLGGGEADERNALLHRPLVVGAGPAGLFCALLLARNGYRPIVIERGAPMEERIADVERFWRTGELDTSSNIQFGEGGAGTFSDGKLTTNVKDKNGRHAFVLETFIEAGAPEDIAYEQYPHIGTDRLREVIVQLRREIENCGGEVRFHTQMTEILSEKGHVTGVRVQRMTGSGAARPSLDSGAVRETNASSPDSGTVKDANVERLSEDCSSEVIGTQVLVLAPGHSARDTVRMLHAMGVPMKQKNFAVGFRVSHPQSMIDERMYGSLSEEEKRRMKLPHCSYKLTAQLSSGRGVYSFCMCPGGYIVNASSGKEQLVVNGMSDYARDSARANSAIVMTVGSAEFGSEDVLAGMQFQERLEKQAYELADGRIPVESYEKFRRGSQSAAKLQDNLHGTQPLTDAECEAICLKGRAAFAPLHTLLPVDMTADFIEGMERFEKIIPGFTGKDAYVCGLESRTSSPVRILRGDDFQSELQGLFPCGEGAGYAGGIISAAIDGIKAAEAVAIFLSEQRHLW